MFDDILPEFNQRPATGIAVDASTIVSNPGPTEYRAIDLRNGKVIFHTHIGHTSNNVGEYCAIVQAIVYCENNRIRTIIYSDSKIAINWVLKKYTNSNVESCPEAAILLQECERYIKKLKYTPKIVWWSKGKLGEIPADFNRK